VRVLPECGRYRRSANYKEAAQATLPHGALDLEPGDGGAASHRVPKPCQLGSPNRKSSAIIFSTGTGSMS
jgi:hypothetical protein